MRERDESIDADDGPEPGPERDDGIPVLTDVEERWPDDAAPRAARDAAPPQPEVEERFADEAPTARIDASEDRIAALIAELATLRAATERMSARLAVLEGTTRDERDIPVLLAAVWMLEWTDEGGPRSAALGARTRIGRAAECDIVIGGAAVSRHHALIHLDPTGAVVEDLNSTNGIFVNGRRVLRERLRDGDVLTLGEAKFHVTGPEAPQRPAP